MEDKLQSSLGMAGSCWGCYEYCTLYDL